MENVSDEYDPSNRFGGEADKDSNKASRYVASCIVTLLVSVYQYEQGHTVPGCRDSLHSTGGTHDKSVSRPTKHLPTP